MVEKRCPSCGADLRAIDEACPFCGHVADQPQPDLPPPPEVPPPESRGPWAVADSESPPDHDAVGIAPPAWEQRARVGFWLALWLTWRDSVFRPVPFFRRLPPRGGMGPALGYMLIFFIIASLAGYYWGLIEVSLAGLDSGVVGLVDVIGFLIGLAVLLPVYLVMVFVTVALLQVGFRLVGAGERGFAATFRAVAYAHGPAAFAVLPFFGSWLGMIWGSVLAYIGAREIQRTTNGRTVLAFSLPALAALLIAIILGAVVALLIDPAALYVPE